MIKVEITRRIKKSTFLPSKRAYIVLIERTIEPNVTGWLQISKTRQKQVDLM